MGVPLRCLLPHLDLKIDYFSLWIGKIIKIFLNELFAHNEILRQLDLDKKDYIDEKITYLAQQFNAKIFGNDRRNTPSRSHQGIL